MLLSRGQLFKTPTGPYMNIHFLIYIHSCNNSFNLSILPNYTVFYMSRYTHWQLLICLHLPTFTCFLLSLPLKWLRCPFKTYTPPYILCYYRSLSGLESTTSQGLLQVAAVYDITVTMVIYLLWKCIYGCEWAEDEQWLHQLIPLALDSCTVRCRFDL